MFIDFYRKNYDIDVKKNQFVFAYKVILLIKLGFMNVQKEFS